MFLKLSLFIFFLSFVRICFYVFLKVVKGPADRSIVRNILIMGPIASIYIYYLKFAPFPLIHFNGSTGYLSILLTFSTYWLCRAGILWGSIGYVLILTRFIVYWFGLYGGIWSPLVRYSGYMFQFWVRLIPLVVGGMFDVGPVIGLQIHQRATVIFRRSLWCPLPPGILTYDESENTFDIHHQLLDNFYALLNYIIPPLKELTSISMLNRNMVFLPFPENFTDYKSGYLIPFSGGWNISSLYNDFFWVINRVPSPYTPEDLHFYFFDFTSYFN